MTVYVFIGPTLREEEVVSVLPEAVCLPPVSQGDVYRAAARRPSAIGIVDGYFSGAPSVWHKEILWALCEGVHVFGSASMGALRAAELHAYGMRGIGRIFEHFRDGRLEDDDEVAVVHGPPETGFLAASEPMVNMRATLDRAEAEGTLSKAARSRLEAAAKSLFFPHRTWPAVVRAVAGEDFAETELSRFREWLAEGSVDQKREDALEMLAAMRSALAKGELCRADFHFESTHFWNDLVARASHEASEPASVGEERGRILEELRLLGPDVYENAARNALLRMLAACKPRGRAPGITDDRKAAVSARLREELGLFSSTQLRSWMAESDLDERSYDRLVEEEANLEAVAEGSRMSLEPYLIDELRLSDAYGRLLARARDKAQFLAGAQRAVRAPADVPNLAQIRVWFFETRLTRPIPEDVEAFVRALGFSGFAEFDRALRDEFMYSRYASRRADNSDGDADGISPPGGCDVP